MHVCVHVCVCECVHVCVCECVHVCVCEYVFVTIMCVRTHTHTRVLWHFFDSLGDTVVMCKFQVQILAKW